MGYIIAFIMAGILSLGYKFGVFRLVATSNQGQLTGSNQTFVPALPACSKLGIEVKLDSQNQNMICTVCNVRAGDYDNVQFSEVGNRNKLSHVLRGLKRSAVGYVQAGQILCVSADSKTASCLDIAVTNLTNNPIMLSDTLGQKSYRLPPHAINMSIRLEVKGRNDVGMHVHKVSFQVQLLSA